MNILPVVDHDDAPALPVIARATGRPRLLLEYHGELLSIAQISERTGTPEQRIRSRMHKGWSIEEAADTATCGMDTWKARRELALPPAPLPPDDTPEGRRMRAAQKIAKEIICGNADAFRFRCIVPMLVYAFDGELLSYTISFGSTADTCTAVLEGFIHNRTRPMLRRIYTVVKTQINEVCHT